MVFLATICLCLWVCADSALAQNNAPEIRISVSQQKLYLVQGTKIIRQYPISTSVYGIGNIEGSYRTPLGRHRVARKIGDGAPPGTIFKERRNTKKTVKINTTLTPTPGDYVTTRILWLEGLQPGVNRGGKVDSFNRCIYIHGTPDEGLIGRPASHGCIRMKNKDVIELFDLVPFGTLVTIFEK